MNTASKEEAMTLEILQAIEEQDEVTQRHLATRMGIALGLANSYLKRCIKMGFVKFEQAPANRYLYYLTPKGFAEKSRLTAQYLSYSLSFYRKAVASCEALFELCRAQGWLRVVLCGDSELAEIARLQARRYDVDVIVVLQHDALTDADGRRGGQADLPEADAYLVTDLIDPAGVHRAIAGRGAGYRVLVPDVLGLGVSNPTQ